jgi:membrane protein DedA with SNARE-associated domain
MSNRLRARRADRLDEWRLCLMIDHKAEAEAELARVHSCAATPGCMKSADHGRRGDMRHPGGLHATAALFLYRRNVPEPSLLNRASTLAFIPAEGDPVISWRMTPHEAHLIAQAGYGAIMFAVGIESLGVPFPGEATLLAAAIYAGTTHHLNIAGVVAAAAAGAIIGSTLSFEIGRALGFWALTHYGRKIGMNDRRIRLGQYLFLRHGGKVVFFGRFVALLRALAAFLAGANRMSWAQFMVFNTAGAVIWAGLYGGGAYVFGKEIHRFLGPVGATLGVIAVALIVTGFMFLRKNENRLQAEAERVLSSITSCEIESTCSKPPAIDGPSDGSPHP